MPEQLSHSIGIMGTILGFDYGRRRTGIAVGQMITNSARPLTTMKMTDQHKPDWPVIDRLIKDWTPVFLVVGYPTQADGRGTRLSMEIEAFANSLKNRYKLPVSFIDEQLTSKEAESELRDQRANGQRSRLRKEDIDQKAAAVLLRDWLVQNTESLHSHRPYIV